jgi:hypothetical protein
MAELNVEAGLRQLPECLREIRSLLSWAELTLSEARPGTPPSFRIDHHSQEDLRNACRAFIKTAMDLREVLGVKGKHQGSEAERARWKKRLLRLEEEFRKLSQADRFIKP